jgi:hypothetical protein
VRRVLRIVVFAVLTAGGTVLGGWWVVPVLASGWVLGFPSDRHPVRTTVVGAALGWGAVLGVDAMSGPVAAVASSLAATMGLPRGGFVAATMLFPALLAGAAALLVKPAPPA